MEQFDPALGTSLGTSPMTFDGTVNAGRKGVAYDWQALLAAAEATTLDQDLLRLTPATHAA